MERKAIQNVHIEQSILWNDNDINELMLGLLVRSLQTIHSKKSSAADKQEALDWVLSTLDETPFSCANCCKTLSLNHDYLRLLVFKLTVGDFEYVSK